MNLNPLLLEEKYQECLQHKVNHIENGKKCGAAPIKIEVANWLLKFCTAPSFQRRVGEDFAVLEIGTGTGLSTFVIKSALPDSQIDTMETEGVHIKIAKDNLIKWGVGIENINFIEGEFVGEKKCEEIYDLIFFDGYSPNSSFLTFFEKYLKAGGVLISGNSHLKRIDAGYFPNLANEDSWTFLEEFEDLKVYKRV